MEIDRPIFIVGPHRSGTTLLYRTLSKHPDVAYFNLANRRFRSFPVIAHVLTRLGMEDAPRELQRIWDRYWTGEDDVMGAQDATPEAVAWHRKMVKRVLRLRGAGRFLAKYPRLSARLDWIDAVFPGALFVHMVRDWRAVVNSTLTRRRKRDAKVGPWYGDRIPGWKEMGELPPEIVAGRQYRFLTETLEEQGPRYEGRFLTVRYAEFCRNPVETVRDIARHCGLEWCAEFEETVPLTLRSANYKWREQLDPSQVEMVRSEAPEFFARHEEAD